VADCRTSRLVSPFAFRKQIATGREESLNFTFRNRAAGSRSP
jgi:hypothetical protein